MIPAVPGRPDISHKGDYGRGLIVGGGRGMAGAAALAGMACLKSGVGLLKIGTSIESQPIVASFDPCYMTLPLSQDANGLINAEGAAELADSIEAATAIAIGPGLGQSKDLVDFVSSAYAKVPQPMVIDADGLNCLSQNPGILTRPGGPRVLTPHQGELRRLLGDNYSEQEELYARAENLARDAGIVLVLKGHRSLVTAGDISVQNPTGNSGMATGGSGDVLTGVVLALLCQKMPTFQAAQLGCLIHGLAGDKAAKRQGKVSLIATDIVKSIPKAILAIKHGKTTWRSARKDETTN